MSRADGRRAPVFAGLVEQSLYVSRSLCQKFMVAGRGRAVRGRDVVRGGRRAGGLELGLDFCVVVMLHESSCPDNSAEATKASGKRGDRQKIHRELERQSRQQQACNDASVARDAAAAAGAGRGADVSLRALDHRAALVGRGSDERPAAPGPASSPSRVQLRRAVGARRRRRLRRGGRGVRRRRALRGRRRPRRRPGPEARPSWRTSGSRSRHSNSLRKLRPRGRRSRRRGGGAAAVQHGQAAERRRRPAPAPQSEGRAVDGPRSGGRGRRTRWRLVEEVSNVLRGREHLPQAGRERVVLLHAAGRGGGRPAAAAAADDGAEERPEQVRRREGQGRQAHIHQSVVECRGGAGPQVRRRWKVVRDDAKRGRMQDLAGEAAHCRAVAVQW